MPLLKTWDRTEKRMVMPLKEALGLPTHLLWTEDSLLPGYRPALIQSFRKSVKALEGMGPQGATPSPSTLHRRFQGFADKPDPVPDLSHKRGPKPSACQMAGGTRIKLQRAGHNAGGVDIRLVVGSRTPQGKLEVLDVSVGDSWETVAQRLQKRLVEDNPAYLRYLLETGKKTLLFANRLESIWSRIVLRIKKIGRRWSRLGALRMLASSLLYVLHPDRYQQLEAQIRGDCLPHVSMVITSLKPEWIA